MPQKFYEIFLGQKHTSPESWQKLLVAVQKFLGFTKPWRLLICLDEVTLHFYLNVKGALPASLDVPDFLLKEVEPPLGQQETNPKLVRPFLFKTPNSLAEIFQDFLKKGYDFDYLEISFLAYPTRPFVSAMVNYRIASKSYARGWLMSNPTEFLSFDFSRNQNFCYKKFPKYLSVEKSLKYFSQDCEHALMQVETFPFNGKPVFLKLDDYDFFKHSFVLGSSGAGKSKFLSLFIRELVQRPDYKVVVVDPHDALRQDLCGIQSRQIINFRNAKQSVDLFGGSSLDTGAEVELLVGIFKELIGESYNGRLERMLRFSCYLLLAHGDFSFVTLRELLVELEVRNRLVAEMHGKIPTSVEHFFLTEFSELKNKAYDQAIAPIIAFLDEMSMVPVFSERKIPQDVTQIVTDNSLTLFSLNRLKLGDKVVKTLASLVYQQLFLLAESGQIEEKLVIVIDEVAVVESEILSRFLSELRKYNVAVVLAGQYFDQVSANLKSAILANTTNYYIFRVSKADAEILTHNINVKVSGDDGEDAAEQFLTGLKLRECLVRVEKQGKLLPPFHAKTTDLNTEHDDEDDEVEDNAESIVKAAPISYDFLKLDAQLSCDDVMHMMSTSRKILPEK